MRFRRLVQRYRESCNAAALPSETTVTHVLGALAKLWLYADEHIDDANTLRASSDDINQFIGLENFCNLMPADWFQVVDPDHIQLPDFLEHNGAIPKKRAVTSLRVARHRKAALRNGQALQGADTCNAVALLDQTRPDQTLKKNKQKKIANETAHRLPADWAPTSADIQYAQNLGLTASAVLEAFADYWKAASGAHARKHDWSAAWRTWCRNSHDRKNGPSMARHGNGLQPAPNHTAAWAEARAHAKAIGFREPHEHESVGAYQTALKLTNNAPRASMEVIRDRVRALTTKLSQ